MNVEELNLHTASVRTVNFFFGLYPVTSEVAVLGKADHNGEGRILNTPVIVFSFHPANAFLKVEMTINRWIELGNNVIVKKTPATHHVVVVILRVEGSTTDCLVNHVIAKLKIKRSIIQHICRISRGDLQNSSRAS